MTVKRTRRIGALALMTVAGFLHSTQAHPEPAAPEVPFLSRASLESAAPAFRTVEEHAGVQVPQTGTIRGTVTRAGTGKPISGARVTAMPSGVTPDLPSGSPSPASLTDNDGAFRLRGLRSGAYTLKVEADGYVTGVLHSPIPLASNQQLSGVSVRLTPAGNIGGRVMDPAGQPGSGVLMLLLRCDYERPGSRFCQPEGGTTTDDRGAYRFYWVTPGRYYLMATEPVGGGSPFIQTLSWDVNERRPAYAFYPGVTAMSAARAIDLEAGADLMALNVTLPRDPPVFRIWGRLTDSRAGAPPPQAKVSVSAWMPDFGAYRFVYETLGLAPARNYYDAATGTFEIRGLPAGTYAVTATVADPPPAGAVQSASRSTVTAMVALSAADVELNLIAAPDISAAVRISVDGKPATPPAVALLLAPLISVDPFSGAGSPSRDINRTYTVSAGDYRVRAGVSSGGPAGGVYIKEARFAGADAFAGPIHITAATPGAIEIVVGLNGGQLQGVVRDGQLKPVPDARVVLVPDRNRDREDLYKTVTADRNGQFSIAGIAPGDYRAFSRERAGDRSSGWFYDPEIIASFEKRGAAVHVAESSVQPIQIQYLGSEDAR